jgi:hypothetical protein
MREKERRKRDRETERTRGYLEREYYQGFRGAISFLLSFRFPFGCWSDGEGEGHRRVSLSHTLDEFPHSDAHFPHDLIAKRLLLMDQNEERGRFVLRRETERVGGRKERKKEI